MKSKKGKKPEKSSASEARVVLGVMVVITFVLTVFLLVTSALSTNVKAIILVIWIAVMMTVLRRYPLAE